MKKLITAVIGASNPEVKLMPKSKSLPTLLSAMRVRLMKATPGKWLTGYPNAGQITPMAGHVWSETKELVAKDLSKGDAELIAHAPTDIAKLIEACEVMAEALESISSIKAKNEAAHVSKSYWQGLSHEECADTLSIDTVMARAALAKAAEVLGRE